MKTYKMKTYKLQIYFGLQYGTIEVVAKNLRDAISRAFELVPNAVEIKLATY